MPQKVKSCVSKLKKKGYSESSAYGICSDSTGIKRKAGGGWTQGKKSSSKKRR